MSKVKVSKDDCLKHINSKFPRIYKALTLFWGDRDFAKYVDSLIKDDRGTRHGFDFTTLSYLINLQAYHDIEFPQFKLKSKDIWSDSVLDYDS